MNEEQKSWLYEAMMHLEMVDETMGIGEATDRATAALYLVQRAILGFKPENYDQVMETVWGTDAQNELADIKERSKNGGQL